MTSTPPDNITADRNEHLLIITWNDGKECRYPFAGLRAVCPCAECQGGHDNMGQPADKELLYAAKDPADQPGKPGTGGQLRPQFHLERRPLAGHLYLAVFV